MDAVAAILHKANAFLPGRFLLSLTSVAERAVHALTSHNTTDKYKWYCDLNSLLPTIRTIEMDFGEMDNHNTDVLWLGIYNGGGRVVYWTTATCS